MAMDLEALRREAPHCHGVAWLAGSPLAVVASDGEPVVVASWAAVARAAPVLLHDGPIASPEVLIRGEAALLLLAERGSGDERGVVAVIVAASGGSPGMALVQARMLAGNVMGNVGGDAAP